jgi:hypothetical protein
VIMVHLSLEGGSPLVTVVTGFIQVLILLILTAFFGMYWGGTASDTLELLVVILVVVTMGRTLGLGYIRWSSQAFGFTLVECYDQNEVRRVLRLLASMPEVLVEINGAQYLWGTRVVGHNEFRRWLVSAEKGRYDGLGSSLGDGLRMANGTRNGNSKSQQEEKAVTRAPTEIKASQAQSPAVSPAPPQCQVTHDP